MKIILSLIVAVCACSGGLLWSSKHLALFPADSHSGVQTGDIEEKEEIRKTLVFGSGTTAKQLVVDNIDGSIRVTSYDGRDVQLVVHKTIRAESAEALKEIKEQMRLDITDQRDTIELFVDTPSRDNDRERRFGRDSQDSRGKWNWKGWQSKRSSVIYDFQLNVPTTTNIALRTVNNGDISVIGMAGAFNIENINGKIDMSDVSGKGRVYAVNGGVTVSFSNNPTGKCYIGSLNGNIYAKFRPNLAADLRFKTFNGAAYTDFEVTPIPNDTIIHEYRKGKNTYKSSEFSAVRVGSGGPELSFDAFNGTINILKRN